MSYYASLGGGRSPARPSSATYQRQLTAAARRTEKAEAAEHASRLFQALLDIHRESFAPAQRPVAPLPPLPDPEAIRERHREAALRDVSRFQRAERAARRDRADRAAEAEMHRLWQDAQRQQAAYQADLDAWWRSLEVNEPGAVLGALAEAFEDNEATAAPVGVDGDEVSVVVLAPTDDIVPERMPGTTAAGNLSLRKLAKRERDSMYLFAIVGHALVTVKEALAVAPGIQSVRLVVLRPAGTDAYGQPKMEAILAGVWSRSALSGVAWAAAQATTIAEETATELLVNLRGGTQLQPLDLRSHPSIRELLTVVDAEELLS